MAPSATLDAPAASRVAGRRPILVTGSHRSGSTWVGKILTRAPGLGYIHEPFKPSVSPGIFPKPFPLWYQYLCADNEGDYPAIFRHVVEFRFSVRSEWATVKNPNGAVRLLRRWFRRSSMRWRGLRPLMKDPLAVFSCEWLERHYDFRPVILIRHPAAFASSLKVKKWGIHFKNFVGQPCLVRDHLRAFESELIDQANNKRDVVARAALLWKCIYSTVAGFQERHPDWIFLRHEDLSRNAVEGFRQLYGQLGLEFTPSVQQFIERTSGAHNPAERHSGGGVRRDSVKNIQNWKKRLTPEEIECVRAGTAPVWQRFYGAEDW